MSTPEGGVVREADDYTMTRDRIIASEAPGVIKRLFSDDDEIREWVGKQEIPAIGRQPAREKIRMINILMDGVSGISDYQTRQILDDRYHRLQTNFPPDESITLDSVKKIPRMDEIGKAHDLSKTRDWIAKYWF